MATYKDTISKNYGSVLFNASNIIDNPKKVFSVSPAIDVGLSGGVPEGSWVSFAGPTGCGKSTTGLQLMASMQADGRKCFYLDVEHRLKPMNLQGIHGLDADKIEIVRSTPDRLLNAEEFLEIGCQIIRDPSNFGGVLIVDSSSALCPSKEIVDPVSGEIRSTQPKIMASFCRKMSGVVNVTNFVVVIIQHVITNTSGYGAKWVVDGGEKIKYQLDVRMITKNQPEKWGDARKPAGQIVEWDILKSALGQSGLKCTSYIRYGHGLDNVKEVCALATELSVIDKAGAWYKFTHAGKEYKFQGEEKLSNAIEASPEIYTYLFDTCKHMLGI